jgi:hypothetical protein
MAMNFGNLVVGAARAMEKRDERKMREIERDMRKAQLDQLLMQSEYMPEQMRIAKELAESNLLTSKANREQLLPQQLREIESRIAGQEDERSWASKLLKLAPTAISTFGDPLRQAFIGLTPMEQQQMVESQARIRNYDRPPQGQTPSFQEKVFNLFLKSAGDDPVKAYQMMQESERAPGNIPEPKPADIGDLTQRASDVATLLNISNNPSGMIGQLFGGSKTQIDQIKKNVESNPEYARLLFRSLTKEQLDTLKENWGVDLSEIISRPPPVSPSRRYDVLPSLPTRADYRGRSGLR